MTTSLWLDLGIFATTTLSTLMHYWNYHNYDATIRNFILLVGSVLHLFSSINRLICPINHNSHQISCILKVLYNDIGVYFNVCTKIIYIICIHMFIGHIMNLKINIWTLSLLFKSKNWYFNSENYYFNYIYIYIYENLKLDIWIWKLLFQFRKLLIDYKNGYFNF
jgi:hypothetical protein